MTDANAILMGSGAPAIKFDTIGIQHTGTVVREPEASQQTDFRTKLPETWKDGSPKMQVVVRLATALRDPAKADDDGERNLYIKGKHLTDAIRAAIRASGANGIHTGGVLTVAYVGDGPAEVGFNPPKLYAATYQPPAVSLTGLTPAPAPVAAPAVVQPPLAASVLGAPAAVVKPPNVDQAMWDQLTPEQKAAVAASAAAPAY